MHFYEIVGMLRWCEKFVVPFKNVQFQTSSAIFLLSNGNFDVNNAIGNKMIIEARIEWIESLWVKIVVSAGVRPV